MHSSIFLALLPFAKIFKSTAGRTPITDIRRLSIRIGIPDNGRLYFESKRQ